LAKGILTPSFIEIAPAVRKRALLMDDHGRHVIAIAHELKSNKRIHNRIYLTTMDTEME
jgi:hypothetical protein